MLYSPPAIIIIDPKELDEFEFISTVPAFVIVDDEATIIKILSINNFPIVNLIPP